MRIHGWLFIAFVFAFAGASCSLKTKTPGAVSVQIARQSQPLQAASSLFDYFTALAAPSTLDNFNCFTLNVTGNGLQGGRFPGCTTQGTGVTVVGAVAPPSGSSTFSMLLPLGTELLVDVYGLYPAPADCSLTSNAMNFGDASAYRVGRVTANPAAGDNVIVPISFMSGISASFGCGANSGAGSGSSSNFAYYAYLPDLFGPTINGYSINATTGTPSFLAPKIGPATMTRIEASPDGLTLFGFESNNLHAFPVTAATGVLGAVVSQASFDTANIADIAVSSDSSMVWMLTAASVITYSWNGSAFTFVGTVAHAAGTPQKLFTTGKSGFGWIYDSGVPGFMLSTVNAAGVFGVPAADLAVSSNNTVFDPLGRFMYGTGPSLIQIITINTGTGVLTNAGTLGTPSTAPGTITPSKLAFNPSGTGLYASYGGAGGKAEGYSINAATGALTAVGAVQNSTGTNGQGITVDASGLFVVFVGQGGSPVIETYAIDPATKGLSSAPVPLGLGAFQSGTPAVARPVIP